MSLIWTNFEVQGYQQGRGERQVVEEAQVRGRLWGGKQGPEEEEGSWMGEVRCFRAGVVRGIMKQRNTYGEALDNRV